MCRASSEAAPSGSVSLRNGDNHNDALTVSAAGIVEIWDDAGSGAKASADLFVNDRIVRVWSAVTFSHTGGGKGYTYDVRLSELGPVGDNGWRDHQRVVSFIMPEGAESREAKRSICRMVARKALRTASLGTTEQRETMRRYIASIA